MIFWKEWRETRFGFLTTLFFMTGLYASMPGKIALGEEYWIGVLLTFFGMAIAIVMGAGALAPEVESETIAFVLTKPVGKAKYLTAKYIVRGGEAFLLVAVPLGFMTFGDWEGFDNWRWCPPFWSAQNIIAVLVLIAFTYSGAFLCSVLFKRQALSALAAITLLMAYLAWRGVGAYRKVYHFETLEKEILIVILLIAGTYAASLIAFRFKEF